MTLLEQLERELERVKVQRQRLTREQSVLTEQITRLRTGAAPEVVCAALQSRLWRALGPLSACRTRRRYRSPGAERSASPHGRCLERPAQVVIAPSFD